VEEDTLMHLSVIIPAYNEEQRIDQTLRVMHVYLQRQPYAAEIIVEDDGSQDGTVSVVRACEGWLPPISVLQHGRKRGKAVSVRQGFLHARGEYLLFSDADLSTSIEEVQKLFAALREPWDICHRFMGTTGIARRGPSTLVSGAHGTIVQCLGAGPRSPRHLRYPMRVQVFQT
jgi:glycosyltransferase involved in cell wall biosynthesis